LAPPRRVGATHQDPSRTPQSQLFNAAPTSIGVAGTSGKSTITGMIAWILHQAGRAPTVMNGAVMKNFANADHPFASALVGGPDLFVSEVDESPTALSLAMSRPSPWSPTSRWTTSRWRSCATCSAASPPARATAVFNLDNPETAGPGAVPPQRTRSITFALGEEAATLNAHDLEALTHRHALHA
jgi:UDP-N-acetylmuramate--alanine ligase